MALEPGLLESTGMIDGVRCLCVLYPSRTGDEEWWNRARLSTQPRQVKECENCASLDEDFFVDGEPIADVRAVWTREEPVLTEGWKQGTSKEPPTRTLQLTSSPHPI